MNIDDKEWERTLIIVKFVLLNTAMGVSYHESYSILVYVKQTIATTAQQEMC